jgi:two-component system sensor histidine kinase/response regulator
MNPLSVLVADDTPANQTIIKSLLQRRGHYVTIASDGRETLNCILRGNIDVVLMDVQMPLMNGYETTRAVREHEQIHGGYVFIIALTTHSAEGDRQACLDAGMDAYLTKPIDAGQLVRMVERLGGCASDDSSAAAKSPAGEERTAEPEPHPSSIIDLPGCLKRLGGDEELFQEFVQVFDEDAPQLMTLLRESIRTRNGSDWERAAHGLRGLTANFGARAAVAAASRLEEIGAGGRWNDAEHAVDQLERELGRLSRALDEHRRS